MMQRRQQRMANKTKAGRNRHSEANKEHNINNEEYRANSVEAREPVGCLREHGGETAC